MHLNKSDSSIKIKLESTETNFGIILYIPSNFQK